MSILPERDHQGAPNSVPITCTLTLAFMAYTFRWRTAAHSVRKHAYGAGYCCKQSILLGAAQRLKHWLMDGDPQRVPVEGA